MKSLVKKVVFGALFLMNVGLVFAHPPVDPPAYVVPPRVQEIASELHEKIEAELEKRRPEFERRKEEIETKYKNKLEKTQAEIISNLNNEYKVKKEEIETKYKNEVKDKEAEIISNFDKKCLKIKSEIQSNYKEGEDNDAAFLRRINELHNETTTEISKFKKELEVEKNAAMFDFECNFKKHLDDTIAPSKEKIESELKDELEELEAWLNRVEIRWDGFRTYSNFKPQTFTTDIPQCILKKYAHIYKNYCSENGCVVYGLFKNPDVFKVTSVADIFVRGSEYDRSFRIPQISIENLEQPILLLDKKTRAFIESNQPEWKPSYTFTVDKRFNISFKDNAYEAFCSCMPRSSFVKEFPCAVD